MSISKLNEADDANLKERIEELERKVNELAEGRMSSWKSDELAPETHEEFLRNIIEYETAPWTTHQQQLQDAGIELPSPEDLDDEQLKAKLWEVIEALGKLRVFLQCTNHLSDRELYAELWGDLLREEVKAVPYDEYSAYHIDLIGSGSEENIHLWMKYYADEETRRQWIEEWPDDEMPDHVDPPCDRDSLLPNAGY